MPNTGDSYSAVLREVHLSWGTLSKDGTRSRSELEAYIPIRAEIARELNIPQGAVYQATSSDGLYNHPLKASGSQGDRKQYGKNFESSGNLKILGQWLKNHCCARPGDEILVEWTSPTDIVLTYIPQNI